MAEANIYTLYSKLDDLLFLVETQLKNTKYSEQKDAEVTDRLTRIITDCYMNHPDNTKGPKEGRWRNYNALSESLDRFQVKYSEAKENHKTATENLVRISELLQQVKSALLETSYIPK